MTRKTIALETPVPPSRDTLPEISGVFQAGTWDSLQIAKNLARSHGYRETEDGLWCSVDHSNVAFSLETVLAIINRQ